MKNIINNIKVMCLALFGFSVRESHGMLEVGGLICLYGHIAPHIATHIGITTHTVLPSVIHHFFGHTAHVAASNIHIVPHY